MPDQTAGQQEEIQVTGPGGTSFRARGTDIISLVGVVAVVLMGYMLWEHKTDSKEAQQQFVAAVKDMTAAQHAQTVAQKLMACILAQPQDKRANEFTNVQSLCRQLSKDGDM